MGSFICLDISHILVGKAYWVFGLDPCSPSWYLLFLTRLKYLPSGGLSWAPYKTNPLSLSLCGGSFTT